MADFTFAIPLARDDLLVRTERWDRFSSQQMQVHPNIFHPNGKRRIFNGTFCIRDHYVVEDITPVRHLKSKLQVKGPI